MMVLLGHAHQYSGHQSWVMEYAHLACWVVLVNGRGRETDGNVCRQLLHIKCRAAPFWAMVVRCSSLMDLLPG